MLSQFLASLLSKNGTPPTSIETGAKVSIVVGDDGPSINRIDLATVVDVDLTVEEITTFATQAKAACPFPRPSPASRTCDWTSRRPEHRPVSSQPWSSIHWTNW